MNTSPQAPSPSPGLHTGSDGRRDFGDPAAELDAVAQGSFVADISHYAVLAFSGEDAQSFLQGQLSCDVDALAGQAISTYGSYCTAKGRMLASFLLWQAGAEWRMVLPRSIVAAIQKRLGMYVLRSKVRISECSGHTVLIGAGGPAAAAGLRALGGNVPMETHQVHLNSSGLSLIALPGQRWLLAAAMDQAQSAWATLAATLTPVGPSAWDWSDIRNGIPWITARTQDQFVPQMANMEAIGGVSFKKGCYPGQEIVARTQYLGKLKRRLYLAHVDAAASEGDELHSDDVSGQSNGMIANAAPAPGGGSDVLAVVQTASAENSRVHLKTSEGPALQFLPLPYPIA